MVFLPKEPLQFYLSLASYTGYIFQKDGICFEEEYGQMNGTAESHKFPRTKSKHRQLLTQMF